MSNQTMFERTGATISVKTKSNAPKLSENCSQITIKEFLTLLTTAYQVQDSVEGVLMEGGKIEALNWLRMKENGGKNSYAQTSESNFEILPAESCEMGEQKEAVKKKSSTTTMSCFDVDPIKQKLNVVLSEGLLDSVLPFLVDNAGNKRKNVIATSNSMPVMPTVAEKQVEKPIRKSVETFIKSSSDVEIHVCDEVKNLKKTFLCNQTLLVSKMGYFSDITVGQKLEDMEISVHCDIGIFEWLMQWVKKDSLLEADWPKLDAHCVVPILVSAAFLQMEPLLNDCLLFCHEHLNDILRTTSNLSCLNDSVLSRLAAMHTNTEVEMIRDKKDKIQSRIFTKMIQSLCEPEAESVRGHWYSLAKIFRCEKCQQLIYPTFSTQIPCNPECMRLQWDGSTISIHVRDPTWNINEYILKLFRITKSWRKVYWKLWANTHFLYCLICRRYFPSHQIGWCLFHPDPPQFFTLDTQKAPLPVGRYPCCGERAYRFDLLPNFSGCQFHQHIPDTKDVRDSAIRTMLDDFRHLIEEEPPRLLFPEKLTRLAPKLNYDTPSPNHDSKMAPPTDLFWWDGFEITPPRPKLGLISKFAKRTTTSNIPAPALPSTSVSDESSDDDGSSSNDSCSSSTTSGSDSTVDSGESCQINKASEPASVSRS
ncbi:unnamed protein product [Brassicogethes aeneus]|uniref:SANT and BTB domain-containing protein n=1 Tax=Brassicogethes aeneus TaxID=1431903 RepID=A0A9P0AVF9_BRAAE|nr:unnamed protein product [Brassicogethes aeneus]